MSNFDHKKWVREQMLKPNNASSVYDYLDFARQVDSTKALTNMYFGNALTYGEKIDKYHQKYISKARKKMTQVNNNESPFGLEYQKYWEGAGQQRINKRKLKTAEKLTDITADLMETIAEDIGNCARKRHHAISSSLVSTSTSNVSSSSSSLPSTSKSSTKHSTSSISLNLRSQVQPLMELVNKFDTSLKNFKIIDFVETGVFELFKHSLDHELFEKLNKPVDQTWAPDEHCAKLLNSISQADPEREDLIVAVRTPVIDPISYRPYKHRDLRAIEIITGNWLDLMTSPLNPILGHHHERTSAIYGVIPIINALFLQYNDKALIEWIGIESDATKRHKWDGVMITNKKPNATIMTIEFAGRFGNEKERENVSDFQKVYRNALRVFNPDSPSASAPYPRIFTVLTSHNKVFFESLVQIDNEVYVRRRSAELTLPTSFSSFQDAVEALPSIFTWRDAVVNYTVSLPKDNQTKNAFETVSPLSSQ